MLACFLKSSSFFGFFIIGLLIKYFWLAINKNTKIKKDKKIWN